MDDGYSPIHFLSKKNPAMRVLNTIFTLFLLFSIKNNLAAQTADWQKKVAPAVLKKASGGQTVHFLAVFSEQADLAGAKNLHSKEAKGQFVFEKLRETADRSQARARFFLHEKKAFANSFYVANLMAVEGDISLIKALVEFPEIARIEPDAEMRLQFFDEKNTVSERGPEWNLQKINADSVWAMGITGQGVTVAGEDTGYDWGHPAIHDKYRGWDGAAADHNYHWHDAIHEFSPLATDTLNPCGLNLQAPCDDNSHGTHTMGSMVGDDGAGNQIGVAPGARWMACRNMERGNGRPSTYIECFQFFLAPTDLAGEKPVPTRAPHVINNSWYCSVEEGCDSSFAPIIMQTVIENLQLAGIVVVVSNGNFGPNCETTTFAPALFAPSFSVGATRQDDTIAGFSSRGGVNFMGKNYIKPDVSAPGQSVRSSIRGGEYAIFSGTSMAGPHVAGLVALIISANPELAGQVEIIQNIIEQTAVRKFSEQDCSGVSSDIFPNNVFGFGRIDALAAVKMARGLPHFEPSAEVFPNPFLDELTIKTVNILGEISFRLFDAAGRLVIEKKGDVDRSLSKTFPVSRLKSGAYFYQISSPAGRFSGKLVKV